MSSDAGARGPSSPLPDHHLEGDKAVTHGRGTPAAESRDEGVSVWDRLRDHKTTLLTGAGAALVLVGCVLAMSAIIDSASFSSGSRQPSGGGASITAPPSREDEPTPPTGPTTPQPSTSSGTASPSQAEDEDEREDSDDDVDDEHDGDDGDDDE